MDPNIQDEVFLVVDSAIKLPTETLCSLCLMPIIVAYAQLSLNTNPPIYYDLSCFKMLIAVGAKYIYEQRSKEETRKN